MEAKRIAIIGIGASGKSVFARKVAERTKLPLFYMDRLFWKGNWKAVPEEEYLKKHQELVKKDSWIIEGYIEENMANRLSRADIVLYLDYPGWLCAWRVIKRWLMHRKVSRFELPKEALEKFSRKFIWIVFTRAERIGIEKSLSIAKPARVIRFRNTSDSDRFLLGQGIQ